MGKNQYGRYAQGKGRHLIIIIFIKEDVMAQLKPIEETKEFLELDLSLPNKIADINLADLGIKEMELSENEKDKMRWLASGTRY